MTIIYFIITIFILVTVHEFGHFITARIFGMHVPIFSVGMGRRILGWNKLNGLTFGPLEEETEALLGRNTDYRLSLLPIGGYAKIDGMIDETQTEALPEEPKPWEFRAKPWWQKSIVISAGVVMNLILAAAIFGIINFSEGNEILTTRTIGHVELKSPAAMAGLQKGDEIQLVNGKAVHNWNEVTQAMIADLGKNTTIVVNRGGKALSARLRSSGEDLQAQLSNMFGISPIGMPIPEIVQVISSDPAERAGIRKGDILTAINGDTVETSEAAIEKIRHHEGDSIRVAWLHQGARLEKLIKPTSAGTIGIQFTNKFAGPIVHKDYGFGEAMTLGVSDLGKHTALLVKSLGMVFTGSVPVGQALGGPIKIAKMAGDSAAGGIGVFFTFMALLSLSLAFLNILPIPALDGGHLVIILVEAAIGHELSQKFKLGFQKVGVALLLSLMAFMVFNDLTNL